MGALPELIESETLYAIGSLIIFARIACRWRLVGFSGFQPDDYMIFFHEYVIYVPIFYCVSI